MAATFVPTAPDEPKGPALASPGASLAGNLLLALPFLLLFYLQLAHHRIWRDELNAFAITWDSPTLSSLLHHIHYEGHPWLWYFVLWIVSRFTHSLLAFKLLEAVIGTASILLLALRSPFRSWEKALLLCGYYIAFEYTVMTRMYGIVLLLLLLYCWRRTNRPNEPIGSAVLLGLMASTDLLGMMLSAALLLEYAYTAFAQRRTHPLFSRRTAALALAVYAALAAVAVWTMRTAPDISWRTTGRMFLNAHSAVHLYKAFLRYTVYAFLCVRSPRSGYFWDPTPGRAGLAAILVLLVILLALYLSLRRYPSLLLLVGVTILMGTLFSHLVYEGSVRHYGITFLSFFAALWILRASDPAAPLPLAAYGLLALLALCGIDAGIMEWHRPFSSASAAAAWIQDHRLETMPLVGQIDASVINVAEHLHRPIYMIECNCVDTYLLFSARRDNYTEADAPERILRAQNYYHGQPLLFVEALPMTLEEKAHIEALGLRVEPLASFPGAEEVIESFYLYRISPGADHAQ